MKWIVGVLLIVCSVFALIAAAQVSGIYDFYAFSPRLVAPLPVLKPLELPTPAPPVTLIVKTNNASDYLIRRSVSGCTFSSFQKLTNERNPTSYHLDRTELHKLPYANVNEALALFPGVYQQQRSAGFSVAGSR